MRVIKNITQINWKIEENKNVALELIDDASEYMRRVEEHIYKGNEIRADQWMDYSEKQEGIKRLDRERTEAHDKLLISAHAFIDLLDENTDFNKSEFRLENRTQIADFIAMIAFELVDMEPESRVEGYIRDELVEKLHNEIISANTIKEKIIMYLE